MELLAEAPGGLQDGELAALADVWVRVPAADALRALQALASSRVRRAADGVL